MERQLLAQSGRSYVFRRSEHGFCKNFTQLGW